MAGELDSLSTCLSLKKMTRVPFYMIMNNCRVSKGEAKDMFWAMMAAGI
jgi:hypothetical protein